jgi:leucyl-tRNA synthetase
VIKMSKSKKNVVDPDEIIATYGADAIRWFMLSDSPPERDLPWSEAGIEGCGRFVQRLWRLFGQYDAAASGEDKALDRKRDQTVAALGQPLAGDQSRAAAGRADDAAPGGGSLEVDGRRHGRGGRLACGRSGAACRG